MKKSELNRIYDAIIVGAGPSGAATAKALSDNGFKSLILEKMELPRYKCCSGLLFGESQVLLKEYFGTLPPEEDYCQPRVISASNVHGYIEEKGFFPWFWEWPKQGKTFPKDYLNVWRNKFDYWLVQQSGGELTDRCLFEDFLVEGDVVKVKARKGEKSLEYRGKYLVGADGGPSKVRDALDPDFKNEYTEVLVYQAYFRYESMNLEQDHMYLFLGSNFGFGGLHVKDGLLTMCVIVPKGEKFKPPFENFKSFLKEKFQAKIGEFVRDEGCQFNDMFATCKFHQGKGRVLLVGDAAGLLHMNGSGIDTSLDSGYRAGRAIAEALKTGGNALELYCKQTEDIRDHIGKCAKHQQMFR